MSWIVGGRGVGVRVLCRMLVVSALLSHEFQISMSGSGSAFADEWSLVPFASNLQLMEGFSNVTEYLFTLRT